MNHDEIRAYAHVTFFNKKQVRRYVPRPLTLPTPDGPQTTRGCRFFVPDPASFDAFVADAVLAGAGLHEAGLVVL